MSDVCVCVCVCRLVVDTTSPANWSVFAVDLVFLVDLTRCTPNID